MRHVYDVFHRLEDKGIKCSVDKHQKPDGTRTTMWNLIPKKLMPPTRLVRYCCAELKETGGNGRMISTGVRWDESKARKQRGVIECIHRDRDKKLILNDCSDESLNAIESYERKCKRCVNPIVDWDESTLWAYIRAEKIDMNPLYYDGFNRVGCIGCPMASKSRAMEFAKYPRIKQAYIRAFDKMLQERKAKGLGSKMQWQTVEDVFHWWMEDDVISGQSYLEGFGERD